MGEIATLITPLAKTRAEFMEECRSGRLDGVVATYRTFPSVSTTGRFDDELVAVLPTTLKFICHNGTYESVLLPSTLRKD